jgi:hypothetical protein
LSDWNREQLGDLFLITHPSSLLFSGQASRNARVQHLEKSSGIFEG